MAAVTDQLGAPASTKYVHGENTLHRYHLLAAGAAAPVTPVNINSVQDAAADAVTFRKSVDLMQQGGGDEYYKYQASPEYNMSIKMYGRDVPAFIAAIRNVSTWGSGYYALPLVFNDDPLINLESIYRLPDNLTHVGTKVYQDLKLRPFNWGSVNDNQVVDVLFRSQYFPFTLYEGYHMCLGKWAGDGSTTTFALGGTPVALWDIAKGWKDQFLLDNLVYCKVWASGATQGVRQKSGVSIVSTDLVFSTAPAASTTVEAFWAVAN